MNIFYNLYFVFFLLMLTSCGPGNHNKGFDKLTNEEQIKFQKYIIQGNDLYKINCSSCHQEDGKGVKKLIPPLASSDYLSKNQAGAARLIQLGAIESIYVNGINYVPTMPAHPLLTHLEIAEILTYINNSWGNEFGFVDGKKVAQYLKK